MLSLFWVKYRLALFCLLLISYMALRVRPPGPQRGFLGSGVENGFWLGCGLQSSRFELQSSGFNLRASFSPLSCLNWIYFSELIFNTLHGFAGKAPRPPKGVFGFGCRKWFLAWLRASIFMLRASIFVLPSHHYYV
jgi:hypothetical protein